MKIYRVVSQTKRGKWLDKKTKHIHRVCMSLVVIFVWNSRVQLTDLKPII